jgi:hypothetical protein
MDFAYNRDRRISMEDDELPSDDFDLVGQRAEGTEDEYEEENIPIH